MVKKGTPSAKQKYIMTLKKQYNTPKKSKGTKYV